MEERPLPGLLVGPGARAAEVGGVLEVLAVSRAGGTPSGPAARPRARVLDDLDELLWPARDVQRNGDGNGNGIAATRAGSGDDEPGGALVLEAELVPREDIGFVRRFLERRPTWRLAVLVADPTGASAQALLALPRARWVPWPPNLDQLAALLLAGPAEGPAAAGDADRGAAPDSDSDPVPIPDPFPDPLARAIARVDDLATRPGQAERGRPDALPRVTPPSPQPVEAEVEEPPRPVDDQAAGPEPDAVADEREAAANGPGASVGPAAAPAAPELPPAEHAGGACGRGAADPHACAATGELTPTPRRPRGGITDLGGLVEELLAGEALSGADAPRYLFRCDGHFPVHGDRAPLTAGISGFLALARKVTGAGGVVSVVVGPLADSEHVLLRIDFPPGDLGEAGIDELLRRAEVGADDASDQLGHALAAAARSAARLRELGADPTLSSLEDGRLRLGVEFASAEAAVLVATEPQPVGGGEDPFA